ncbi:hypothetical protein Lal_00027080 [Lupinus albus]|nr:hypothetical protein Lal_00027080 [Lupinus albus]
MDALDAQNQQVQIELQRLSYKINMMDLDEDSSEPKSWNILFRISSFIFEFVNLGYIGFRVWTLEDSRLSENPLLEQESLA